MRNAIFIFTLMNPRTDCKCRMNSNTSLLALLEHVVFPAVAAFTITNNRQHVQPVAGDKKTGKWPTPSFLRQFLRFPRNLPSNSSVTGRQGRKAFASWNLEPTSLSFYYNSLISFTPQILKVSVSIHPQLAVSTSSIQYLRTYYRIKS